MNGQQANNYMLVDAKEARPRSRALLNVEAPWLVSIGGLREPCITQKVLSRGRAATDGARPPGVTSDRSFKGRQMESSNHADLRPECFG
jgi:hypothetical protein